jgi:hypothetical protein
VQYIGSVQCAVHRISTVYSTVCSTQSQYSVQYIGYSTYGQYSVQYIGSVQCAVHRVST